MCGTVIRAFGRSSLVVDSLAFGGLAGHCFLKGKSAIAVAAGLLRSWVLFFKSRSKCSADVVVAFFYLNTLSVSPF